MNMLNSDGYSICGHENKWFCSLTAPHTGVHRAYHLHVFTVDNFRAEWSDDGTYFYEADPAHVINEEVEISDVLRTLRV